MAAVLIHPWGIHYKLCPSPHPLPRDFQIFREKKCLFGSLVTIRGINGLIVGRLHPSRTTFASACCLQSRWRKLWGAGSHISKLTVETVTARGACPAASLPTARAIWELCNHQHWSEATWWALVAHCFGIMCSYFIFTKPKKIEVQSGN